MIIMNNFEFETQGNSKYLVYEIDESDTIDSMSLGMLTNNQISGFATTSFVQIDSKKIIKYNISEMESAKILFEGIVNRRRLLGVFSGIVNALFSAEEYMIDPNGIVLDLDYIFTDRTTCETFLICLPIVNDDLREKNIGDFLKSIMYTLKFDQSENRDYVTSIVNFINDNQENFSAEAFKNLIESLITGTPVKQLTKKQKPKKTDVIEAKDFFVPSKNTVSQSFQTQPQAQKTSSNDLQQTTFGGKGNIRRENKDLSNFVIHNTESENKTDTVGEKKITLLELLSHYNKENAELYKSQKEARRGTAKKSDKKTSSNSKSSVKSKQQFSFDIPGEESSEFALPMLNELEINTDANIKSLSGKLKKDQQSATLPPQNDSVAAQHMGFADAMPHSKRMDFGETTVLGDNSAVNKSSVIQSVTPQPVIQPPIAQQSVTAQPIVQQPVGISTVNILDVAASSDNSSRIGETTVLNGRIGETTVLMQPIYQGPKTPPPHLLRSKNNEKIYIDKSVFRIGAEKNAVDYCITDNIVVSRTHASVISRDSRYYIVDMNSTNHTYVDGKMIPSNSEVELIHGTKVTFANEDYTFKVY